MHRHSTQRYQEFSPQPAWAKSAAKSQRITLLWGVMFFSMFTAGRVAAQPQVSAGSTHTCVVTTDNKVRCWGLGTNGALGYGNTDTIGDNEVPSSAGDVNVGADVLQVSAGGTHTCAVTTGNKVRCWGEGGFGKLGYGNVNPLTRNIGDDEVPADSGDVNVGADVLQVATGGNHTCAVTTDNTVRCWGRGADGVLGYGSVVSIGGSPFSLPADSGDVNVGAPVLQVATSAGTTCVVTGANTVRCWGNGFFGKLGYGNSDNIGDDEVPADSGDVNVGALVSQVATGDSHTCALTTGNKVRCWGIGISGQIGYGNSDTIGDDEDPASAGDVNVGADVTQISVGSSHTCVVTTGNTVRCWGTGGFGKLGYGGSNDIGDNEVPADSGDVNVGAPVLQVSAGWGHTCVVTTDNMVRCWGYGNYGQLGYGGTNDIGDDEVPADSGNVDVFDVQLPVELTDFRVLVQGERATLSWSTASETANAGFEVHHLFERSGQTFWDVVGFVGGAGSARKPSHYTFDIDELEPGRHRFRLKQIDFDGRFEFTPEVEARIEVPGSHYLSDAYPNPFNPRSHFSFAVPSKQSVRVTLHDAMGRQVQNLFEGDVEANEQRWIRIDGNTLASGVYLYRVEGENFTESRSVTLQK